MGFQGPRKFNGFIGRDGPQFLEFDHLLGVTFRDQRARPQGETVLPLDAQGMVEGALGHGERAFLPAGLTPEPQDRLIRPISLFDLP
jgi:hypothetical protein